MFTMPELFRLTVTPNPHMPDDEIMWRFTVGQDTVDHVFKYVRAYTDTFRDDKGELPPMPALADCDEGQYAWAVLHPDIPASIGVHKAHDGWEFDVIVARPEEPDPHQWIDILHILKKVSRMEFK